MAPDETVPRFFWRLAWGGFFAVLAVGLITLVVLATGAADPPRAGPLLYESDTAKIIPLPAGPYTLEVTGHFAASSDPAEVWGVTLLSNTEIDRRDAIYRALVVDRIDSKGHDMSCPYICSPEIVSALIIRPDFAANYIEDGIQRTIHRTVPTGSLMSAERWWSTSPVAKASGLSDTKPPEGGCTQINVSLSIACFSRLDVVKPGDLSPGVVDQDTHPVAILLNGYGFFAVPPFQPDFTPFIHIRPRGESNKITLDVGNGGQAVLRFNDEIAWRGVIPHAHSAIVKLSAHAALDKIALYAPR